MSPGVPPASASAPKIVSIVARVWRYMSPGASTSPRLLSAVEPAMNTRFPDGARVGVLLLERSSRRDAPSPLPRAVHRVELDLDELLRTRQPVHLHERGGRTRILEMAGNGARRLVRQPDVGDVDAAAHHVVETAADLAHAPRRDLHDGVD